MFCDECPIGKDSIERRRERLKDCGDWQPEYCCCDKIVEDHFWIGGYCGDALSKRPTYSRIGKRRSGRAYRRNKKQQKNERLLNILSTGYMPHAGYVEYDFIDDIWTRVGNHIKYPRNSNRQKWMKRYTSKIVRKTNLPIKGNAYRKCFDYWWTMY